MYYFHIEKNQPPPPPFFFYPTNHPAAEQTTAERDQVTHLGWLSIPILESGRTMLSPVYSASFLGHHSHRHLPAQESPKLLVPSQVLAAGPSWPAPLCCPSPHSPLHQDRDPTFVGCSSKGSRPHPVFTKLSQPSLSQGFPVCPSGLSASCSLLCPLTNDNDNGSHICWILIMGQTWARLPHTLSLILTIIQVLFPVYRSLTLTLTCLNPSVALKVDLVPLSWGPYPLPCLLPFSAPVSGPL